MYLQEQRPPVMYRVYDSKMKTLETPVLQSFAVHVQNKNWKANLHSFVFDVKKHASLQLSEEDCVHIEEKMN